jgi:hypothetical protein
MMLKPLLRQRTISLWDDTMIQPGGFWRQEIETALKRAKVAVLIVSPNFLASDFIYENELPPLLRAAYNQGTSIIWFVVSDCMFEETDLTHFNSVLDPARPLDLMRPGERSRALRRVSEQVKKAFEGMSG